MISKLLDSLMFKVGGSSKVLVRSQVPALPEFADIPTISIDTSEHAELTDITAQSAVTALNELVDEAESHYRNTLKSYSILSEMLMNMGGFVWRRDKDGRYLFVNPSMCALMLMPDIRRGTDGRPAVCIDEVKGLTDIELIDAYKKRTGRDHDFRVHASLVDDQAHKHGTSCRFLQFGQIGGVAKAYYTMVTPMFGKSSVGARGPFIGTTGYAIDETARCDSLHNQIKELRKDGLLVELSTGLYLTQVGDGAEDNTCLPI